MILFRPPCADEARSVAVSLRGGRLPAPDPFASPRLSGASRTRRPGCCLPDSSGQAAA